MTEITEPPAAAGRPEKSQRRWRKRLRRFFSGINLVITLVAALATIGVVVWQFWPRQVYTYIFTGLSHEGATPEPCTFTANGQGTAPAGQVLIVSDQEQGTGDNIDSLLHFGTVTMKPGTDLWYTHVQSGISTTPPGTPYTLTAWLVSADWINYLTQITPNQRTWWSTRAIPPGAKQVATVNIIRDAHDNCRP
jgi:hypothetical protein